MEKHTRPARCSVRWPSHAPAMCSALCTASTARGSSAPKPWTQSCAYSDHLVDFSPKPPRRTTGSAAVRSLFSCIWSRKEPPGNCSKSAVVLGITAAIASPSCRGSSSTLCTRKTDCQGNRKAQRVNSNDCKLTWQQLLLLNQRPRLWWLQLLLQQTIEHLLVMPVRVAQPPRALVAGSP